MNKKNKLLILVILAVFIATTLIISSFVLFGGINNAKAECVDPPCGGGSSYRLTVNSYPDSGVSIELGQSSRVTPFTQIYNSGDTVILIAPSLVGGKSFSAWDGCSSSLSEQCHVTMYSDRVVSAIYGDSLGPTGTLNVLALGRSLSDISGFLLNLSGGSSWAPTSTVVDTQYRNTSTSASSLGSSYAATYSFPSAKNFSNLTNPLNKYLIAGQLNSDGTIEAGISAAGNLSAGGTLTLALVFEKLGISSVTDSNNSNIKTINTLFNDLNLDLARANSVKNFASVSESSTDKLADFAKSLFVINKAKALCCGTGVPGQQCCDLSGNCPPIGGYAAGLDCGGVREGELGSGNVIEFFYTYDLDNQSGSWPQYYPLNSAATTPAGGLNTPPSHTYLPGNYTMAIKAERWISGSLVDTAIVAQTTTVGTPVCPTNQSVTATPNTIALNQTAALSAPAGWSGGAFSCSGVGCSGVLSISGATGTGLTSGSVGVVGSGWVAPNGAANCSLLGAVVNVSQPDVTLSISRHAINQWVVGTTNNPGVLWINKGEKIDLKYIYQDFPNTVTSCVRDLGTSSWRRTDANPVSPSAIFSPTEPISAGIITFKVTCTDGSSPPASANARVNVHIYPIWHEINPGATPTP